MIYQNITLTKENIKFITITTETSDVVTIYPDEITSFNFNLDKYISEKCDKTITSNNSKLDLDLIVSSSQNYKLMNCTGSAEPVSIYYVLSHKIKEIGIFTKDDYYISVSKRDETNELDLDTDYFTEISEIIDGRLHMNITSINPTDIIIFIFNVNDVLFSNGIKIKFEGED